ncbi:hypothetical protein CEUSTIGMA_g793.t1 [Chlamydomonas eustigma]|uniref:Uncharacterized protein n=1 Tax=Chlamydomonas eustigma TaxID=1157962 RepID=A0A250WS23_9CHLO|nr:hypothetical protein CEUSTIGMA_g793.t1 [Chlamydomonas eustigma]|eukprot:GAX73340.1 hypothetical protein CEUSTIGMA_g793.t1 [Chlamydomonas eustigma]
MLMNFWTLYGSVLQEQQVHSQTLAAYAGSGSVQQEPSQNEVAATGSVQQQQWQLPSQATALNVRSVQQEWQLPSQAVAAARGSGSVHLSTSVSRLPGPPAHTLMFSSPLSPARASALISLQTVAHISLKTPAILAKFAEQVAKDGLLSQRGVSSIALSTAINVASTSQSQVHHQPHSTQLSGLPSP